MKHWKCTALLASSLILVPALSHAESRRIVVFPLTQNYVDTRPGDTLSGITARLLPNDPQLRQKLMIEILNLNPNAFIGRNPNRLLANIRLWLPNQRDNAALPADPRHYRIEHFSWGSINRPRQ